MENWCVVVFDFVVICSRYPIVDRSRSECFTPDDRVNVLGFRFVDSGSPDRFTSAAPRLVVPEAWLTVPYRGVIKREQRDSEAPSRMSESMRMFHSVVFPHLFSS